MVSLEACPALVLNADGRPLSYFPLSVWPWQEAVKAVFLGRVQTLSEYDRMVRSPSFEMQLPSVIALREYISLNKRPAFTRFNVFLRDRFSCQYCGQRFETRELTFDHVIPRSRGGRTSWINVVTACRDVQHAQGQQDARRSADAAARKTGLPDDLPVARKRAGLPAQFSSRGLARLPLLGQRTRIRLMAGPRLPCGPVHSRVESQIARRVPLRMAPVIKPWAAALRAP